MFGYIDDKSNEMKPIDKKHWSIVGFLMMMWLVLCVLIEATR